MKHVLSLLLAAALLAPTAVSTAAFEGKVTLKMTDPRGEARELEQSLKPGFSRIDMQIAEGSKGTFIMDLNKKEIIMLMEDQRMYMVTPLPDPAQDQSGKASEVTLEKTGEKEKILGYTAEKYISKSKDTTTELWLTDQLGSFWGFGGPGLGGPGRRGGGEAWERLLKGKELFPLRAVGKTSDGKESFRLEVTKVEKKSLDDSLFAPPEGYQRMDMGNMMRGLGGPGGPRDLPSRR